MGESPDHPECLGGSLRSLRKQADARLFASFRLGLVVVSSLFGMCACCYVYWLTFIIEQAQIHSVILVSLIEEFFNRLKITPDILPLLLLFLVEIGTIV